MSLVPVQFLVSDGPYNTGEIAGFPSKVAARLVARKIAKLHVPASGASAATASLVAGLEVKEADPDETKPAIEPALIAAEERKLIGEEVPTSEAAITEGKLSRRRRR